MAKEAELLTGGIEPLSEAVKGEEEKFLTFYAGGTLYGVRVDRVSEILTEISVARIPLTPPCVLGVINLRGMIPPVLDLRLLLGLEAGKESCTIMLDLDSSVLGLVVDRVDQTVDIPRAGILPIPSQHREKLVSGMCTVPGGGAMMVLDCDQLIHAC